MASVSWGSPRHDRGRAADIKLIKNGATLAFTNHGSSAEVEAFVTAAAARGAIGIGAGEAYVGNDTLQFGFGKTNADTTPAV